MIHHAKIAIMAICIAMAGSAASCQDISDQIAGKIEERGKLAKLTIAGPSWNCVGDYKGQSGSTGKKSGSKIRSGSTSGPAASARQTVRMKCSDGSTATARVALDATWREYSVQFTHSVHGKASLRLSAN